MATVTCTLKYENAQLTKTYHVTFDPKDKINVVTETAGLVIKAANARAKELLPALKNGSAARSPEQVSAEVGPDEFDPPYELAPRAVPATESQFCFSASPAQVAKFICGLRKAGKFTPYPKEDGPEFP
jgi:hypothetical protein